MSSEEPYIWAETQVLVCSPQQGGTLQNHTREHFSQEKWQAVLLGRQNTNREPALARGWYPHVQTAAKFVIDNKRIRNVKIQPFRNLHCMWSTALPLYRKFCWRQSWSLQNLAVDATNSVSSSHWSGEVSVVVSLVWVPEEADGLCAVEVPAPECCSLVRKRWMKLSRSFTTPWLSYWYIYNVILSSSCLSWCKCELRHAVTSLLSSPWGLSGFFTSRVSTIAGLVEVPYQKENSVQEGFWKMELTELFSMQYRVYITEVLWFRQCVVVVDYSSR